MSNDASDFLVASPTYKRKRNRGLARVPSYELSIGSMQSYNLKHAPCFAGSCLVRLADDSEIAVSELSVGAAVKTPVGSSNVIGIIQTKVDPSKNLMCKLDEGLVITPWHPVDVDGWKFPVDIVIPEIIPSCDAVYSVLLEKNVDSDSHAILVGGTYCVTLGHGIQTAGDVRAHPFLSNHSAIAAAVDGAPRDPTTGAKRCNGLRRDIYTGLVTGFNWVSEATVVENMSAIGGQASPVSV